VFDGAGRCKSGGNEQSFDILLGAKHFERACRNVGFPVSPATAQHQNGMADRRSRHERRRPAECLDHSRGRFPVQFLLGRRLRQEPFAQLLFPSPWPMNSWTTLS